ncbi:hypothetical protein SCHPADRAFT_888472 [Schizopora paradoxa]|uniref:Uncharacterized protein n=1 Tax=Schizopora paradoxa TaxID=27342 RepID=A0A0H2RUN4_9AGAM|nr:hypothetical protein SCHPADRAFT_888472 [Schizopora paradoxa]
MDETQKVNELDIDEKDLASNSRSSVTAGEETTGTRARPEFAASSTDISHNAARNLHQFGQSKNIVFVESHVLKEAPACIQEAYNTPGLKGRFLRFYSSYNFDQFIPRPVLHQWIQNGKLYREAKERQASHFELFFDLLFVGIVHQISDAAAESPTGAGLAKYVLTICPAYSIWSDVRDIVNRFGTDDVSQRAYILWIMILLVGYSNNASSIEIGSLEVSEAAEAVLATVDETVTRNSATHWALGFAAVAKFSKVLLILIYSSFLQQAQRALLLANINSLFSSILFLIAIFLPFHAQVGLVAAGIFIEYIMKLMGFVFVKIVEAARHCKARNVSRASTATLTKDEEQGGADTNDSREIISEDIQEGDELEDPVIRRARQYLPLADNQRVGEWVLEQKKHVRIPAINIEHHVDRLGAFVTIVLGEMVANVFFKNSIAPGINNEAGRAFLALMCAFNLNWLYFTSEACGNFIHALRRHWFTGGIFTVIHLPLIMALLLASSAVNKLVVDSDVESGLKFFFGSGVGIGVLCMSIIGMLHKNLDERTMPRKMDSCEGKDKCVDMHHIPQRLLRFERQHILGIRAFVGLGMIFLPFAHERLKSTNLLATYVGITGFLIAEEVLTRLERRPMPVRLD